MNTLIGKKEAATMLGTSPDVAASVLRANGCNPIDFGRGRSRGLRWPKAAVEAAVLAMFEKAQPRPKAKAPRLNIKNPSGKSLADMKTKEVEAMLTKCGPLQ